MPLQQTSGNDTADAYGGGVAAVPNYIEDVFSTWLVTPTSSNTTYSVTNGIDVSGKGGMVWMKSRSAAGNNLVYDTARGASAGANNALITNGTNAQQTANFDYITGLSNGFTVNFATGGGQLTNNGINYASWTFRKQPKFFDVVTYTGTGSNRTIAHNLGSVPGCIIVKRTDTTGNWQVYHNGLTSAAYSIQLNLTNAQASATTVWNSTAPTSTVFSVGTDATVNASGGTYVAYVFASNAGGFGLTGTDNVISCGSYTEGASATTVTLGYEPQWLMIKKTSATSSWYIIDNMRAFDYSDTKYLEANTSAAEVSVGASYFKPTATGFIAEPAFLGNGSNIVYIAIRRGPMKVPTSGTSVFKPDFLYGTDTNISRYLGYVTDFNIVGFRNGSTNAQQVSSRLTGGNTLKTSATDAEAINAITWDSNLGVLPGAGTLNTNFISYAFARAPSFFDEVCFGSSVTTAVPHNLTVPPELIIAKDRSGSGAWYVWQPSTSVRYGTLNTTAAFSAPAGSWPATSTTFEPLIYGSNIVNYLFATCAGVSKVGSYTGNGSTQTINCGFTGGARFVLIKRTDSTGDWYVYDTARGMTTLTDPYLLLNSTAAESATLGSVTTVSTGFAVNASVLAAINTNGASYIFLAVS